MSLAGQPFNNFVVLVNLLRSVATRRAVKDVPPFVTLDGYTSGVVGLNRVGLQRAGYKAATRSCNTQKCLSP